MLDIQQTDREMEQRQTGTLQKQADRTKKGRNRYPERTKLD